ncbi:tetratricopeptide repeat protein [Magnetospirillum molischianum]|uniref:Predicted Fe-S oxidoreductase (Modular protein) n=1 Tax=Magnetospirillum molischianum DSM 120 TaxID=1150626 RepID=H8FU12_MAGML|nr:tetratricopeptide repeat protein [Magnetospirillum molischianum]CCG41850.1 Predicted Fe-S oxidoreductase (modular protein) [Magnetospirillum molischianum DSM 120]
MSQPPRLDPLAPLLTEALAHEQAGRLAEMEGCLRTALRTVPDHPGALFALARLGLRFGHHEDALTLVGRGLVRAPHSPELHHLRGVALANLGRPGEAIEALEHVLALAPDWVDARLDLAQLLFQAERYEALLDRLTSLDGTTPRHAEAHALCGRTLSVLGRQDEARAAFERALALAPDHAEIRADLAALHIEAGQAGAALALVEPLLRDAVLPPRPLYLRGIAQGMLGCEAEAEADIARLRGMMLDGLARRGGLPTEVYVQLSRRCNLRCAMCGHGVWKEAEGFMSDAVFARILDRCDEAGIRRLTVLAAQGEPFLHPKVFELLASAVERGFAVSVVTNATPFTPERIAHLARLGLESVQVSFAGWDAASYESVYIGARFDRTVRTLTALNAALAPTSTRLVVKAVAPDNSPDYVGRTRAFLSSLGITSVTTVAPNNFAGTVETGRYWERVGLWSYRNLDRHRRTVCRLLMRAVGVYVDGTVTACGCYDANAALAIGDLMQDSLKDIRTGPRFAAILDAFRSGDLSAVPLCGKCDDAFG